MFQNIRAMILFAISVFHHKFFILKYGLKVGLPLKRLLIHDFSKFSKEEWLPYARHFYHRTWGAKCSHRHPQIEADFQAALKIHASRNEHHIGYWKDKPNGMTYEALQEMCVDFTAATRVYGGTPPPKKIKDWQWYMTNSQKFKDAECTRMYDLDFETQQVLDKIHG